MGLQANYEFNDNKYFHIYTKIDQIMRVINITFKKAKFQFSSPRLGATKMSDIILTNRVPYHNFKS